VTPAAVAIERLQQTITARDAELAAALEKIPALRRQLAEKGQDLDLVRLKLEDALRRVPQGIREFSRSRSFRTRRRDGRNPLPRRLPRRHAADDKSAGTANSLRRLRRES